MNELDKKFEKKRRQFISDVFSLDWRRFGRIVARETGKRLGGVLSKCTTGLFWGCHPFLLAITKHCRKMGQIRPPQRSYKKAIRSNPTQSLATSGRFARKSIRSDLSRFGRWHTTLYNMVSILIRDAVFNLKVKLGFHKRSHDLFTFILFLDLKERLRHIGRIDLSPGELTSRESIFGRNDLIPKWLYDKPRRT